MSEINKCECSMSISIHGDGCRYCQPQEYIDRLHRHIEQDKEALDELAEWLREQIVKCDRWEGHYLEAIDVYKKVLLEMGVAL